MRASSPSVEVLFAADPDAWIQDPRVHCASCAERAQGDLDDLAAVTDDAEAYYRVGDVRSEVKRLEERVYTHRSRTARPSSSVCS